MAKPVKPEPKFFLVDELFAHGIAYYADRWFAEVPPGRVAGEKSTDYLESAAAAERIARALPLVRLVFILREPVARAYSNYLWSRMNGLEHEDFPTALRLESERERSLPDRLKYARPFSYFSRGLYADLLRPYFDRFPRERVLVLRFEDIISAPAAIGARVQRFISVDPRPEDVEGLGAINASRKDEAALPDDLRAELAARYVAPNRRLQALLGPGFELWSHEVSPHTHGKGERA